MNLHHQKEKSLGGATSPGQNVTARSFLARSRPVLEYNTLFLNKVRGIRAEYWEEREYCNQTHLDSSPGLFPALRAVCQLAGWDGATPGACQDGSTCGAQSLAVSCLHLISDPPSLVSAAFHLQMFVCLFFNVKYVHGYKKKTRLKSYNGKSESLTSHYFCVL